MEANTISIHSHVWWTRRSVSTNHYLNRISKRSKIRKKRTRLTTQKKIVEIKAERNLFGQLVMLSEKHSISLDKTLSYPLGPIP